MAETTADDLDDGLELAEIAGLMVNPSEEAIERARRSEIRGR